MKTVGIDTKVASSHGDIITFEEHCQRLATFIEDIKGKALLLTQRNPELTEYIQSLKLVFLEELYIEDTTCFYFVAVQSPYSIDMPVHPDKIGNWADSVGVDENGYPKLYYDFWVIINRFRERLLADIIMPQIVNDMDFLVLFLKEVLLKNTLKWKYVSEERRGKCYELLFQYNEPDKFWLAITNNVRVLIGEFKEI